jgi:hypothetical protein
VAQGRFASRFISPENSHLLVFRNYGVNSAFDFSIPLLYPWKTRSARRATLSQFVGFLESSVGFLDSRFDFIVPQRPPP